MLPLAAVGWHGWEEGVEGEREGRGGRESWPAGPPSPPVGDVPSLGPRQAAGLGALVRLDAGQDNLEAL